MPDIDTENVKTNLQEFFRNPNLLWELYKTLSLTETDKLNYIEKLSHYSTAKKLYQLIPNIDKFLSSSKTLKSCFKWNIDDFYFLYMSLLPSIFSSFKELFMGKTSRENYLNRLNDEDLQELSNIKINPSDLSKKQTISEIRNALNHTHYVPGKEELYIKNPKNSDPKIHAFDFEADVPYSFLVHFIMLTQTYFRKADYYEFKIDDQELVEDLWENSRNVKYEDVKDKIHILQGVNKYKLWNNVWEDLKKEVVTKEVTRSEQVENLLSKYFTNHKLDQQNLCYVAESLSKAPEIHMWTIFSTIVNNELEWSNKYKWLNSTELINDVYERMVNESYYWFDLLDWLDPVEGKEILDNLCNELTKKRQPNWQSILKHLWWCIDYADKFFKKRGFSPYYEWGRLIYYKKWDVKVDFTSICNWVASARAHYYAVNNMVKLFPDRLRLQFIKMVYVNEQVPLQYENVEWLISKVDTSIDENWMGKKPTRERIRDALSHHTYILLEWVDDIVLRDWYDKKTDTWAREATFSLSKLFEGTYKELDENGMASHYSSLLDFLKKSNN